MSPAPVIVTGARNIRRRLGAPCWKWGVQNTILVFYMWHRFLGSIGCEAGMFQRCAKMSRTAGKWGFYICDLKIASRNSKSGSSNKKKLGRTHPHFCVFGWRAWIMVLQTRPILAETTENVVPKWRGRKTQLCHGRVWKRPSYKRQQDVPEIFSFHCTSFPIHLQAQGKLFDFSCLFVFESRSLSIILMIAFCCA